jgi:hypothetical protein
MSVWNMFLHRRRSTDIVVIDDPGIAAAVHLINQRAPSLAGLSVAEAVGNLVVSHRQFEQRFRLARWTAPPATRFTACKSSAGQDAAGRNRPGDAGGRASQRLRQGQTHS